MIKNTLKNSLSRRISFIIGAVVTSILLFFSLLFIGYEILNINKQLDQKIERLTQLAETSLISIIWHLDKPAISNVLAAISSDENVAYVGLVVDGEMLIHQVQPEYTTLSFFYFQNRSGFVSKTTDILYLGSKIGEFQIVLSKDRIQQQLIWEVLGIIALQLFTVLGVFFGSLYLVGRYVKQPLVRLERTAHFITRGNFEQAFDGEFNKIENDDEIGVLARAFNKMILQLKSNIDTLDIKVRERTEELQKAKEAAEKAASSKADFLAAMSHEIRTPMNAILGMSELLNETNLTSKQQYLVRTLSTSSEILLSLINDILDFSKIDSDQVELENIAFDLAEQIESVTKLLAIRAHAKDLELICRIAPDVELNREGDPTRIRQIVINLLGNAIKFTSEGEIFIEVTNTAADPDPDLLTIQVRDTGMGIPQNKQTDIFERFSQADMSTTRKYGGTGLGLSISKRLVELMGGEIQVQSEVDQGTTFCLTLRLKRLDQPQTLTTKSLKNLNVLLVDDNKTHRCTVKEILTVSGANITEAANGGDAIQVLSIRQKIGPSFDLLLLDGQMPGLSGLELTKHIRAMKLMPRMRIIMFTTSSENLDGSLQEKVGISKCLTKPIHRRDLLETVEILLKKPLQKSQIPNIDLLNDVQPVPMMRVLVAEDIEANRNLLSLFLENLKLDLEFAENGREAVEKFSVGRYDLILMDIQMPVLDGYQATTRIRQWESAQNLKPVPIIALTAHAFVQQKKLCLDAGCTDFLSKPIQKKLLIEKLLAVSDRLEDPPLPNLGLSQKSGGSKKKTTDDQFDDRQSQQRNQGQERLRHLIPELMKEIGAKLSDMQHALEKNDFETLRIMGHGFKGAAANYGLSHLTQLFLEVELAAKTADCRQLNQTIDKISKTIDQAGEKVL